MFAPFKLRELTLENRVVVSPMAMYSAVDGMPDDFHLVHYGARALGGAGLVFTEMTCVSPEGRITPGCTGMWNARARRGLDSGSSISSTPARRRRSASSSAIRAPKGSTKLGWEGERRPLDDGNWPVMAAVGDPVVAGQPGAARDDARRHGRGDRGQFVAAAERAA